MSRLINKGKFKVIDWYYEMSNLIIRIANKHAQIFVHFPHGRGKLFLFPTHDRVIDAMDQLSQKKKGNP